MKDLCDAAWIVSNLLKDWEHWTLMPLVEVSPGVWARSQAEHESAQGYRQAVRVLNYLIEQCK